jgi:hypothetical protein
LSPKTARCGWHLLGSCSVSSRVAYIERLPSSTKTMPSRASSGRRRRSVDWLIQKRSRISAEETAPSRLRT